MKETLKRNFTQLRKNTRSRKEKKCGKKKPRPQTRNIIIIMHIVIADEIKPTAQKILDELGSASEEDCMNQTKKSNRPSDVDVGRLL